MEEIANNKSDDHLTMHEAKASPSVPGIIRACTVRVNFFGSIISIKVHSCAIHFIWKPTGRHIVSFMASENIETRL